MVERIEHFEPELQPQLFGEAETFGEIKIEIHHAGSAKDADSGVAEDFVGCVRCQRHERAGVKPTIDSALARREGAVGNAVGTAAAFAANVDRLRLIDGQRQAALPCEYRRKFPTAQCHTHSVGPVAADGVPRSKWQLPHTRKNETMRNIKLCGTILQPAV